MIFTEAQMTEEVKKEMRGGHGEAHLHHILSGEHLNGKGRLFAQITLEPGNSIGYHEHHEESEVFYILSGEGTLSDNGVQKPLSQGQCAVCPDGEGHAIENTGTETLVILALILYK